MKLKLVTAASVAALGLAASGARAQTMDYGSLEQLFGEPVTTSATGSPKKAADAPVDMVIITQDEIRRSGATDIPGVLKHVAGIDVLQFGSDNAEVAVRGYDVAFTSRLLVLVDGRQVYADYLGYMPWSTIPVELGAIRQIEVVKGPNSALFGFNAVGGVINIITYNPLYDDVNTVSVSGGTQGLLEGSAVNTIKLGDIGGIRISTGGRVDNDFSTPEELTSQGSRRGNNRGAIDVEGAFRLGDNVVATVDASHTEVDQDQFSVNDYYQYYRYGTNSLKGQLNADTPIGALQGSIYSNWIRSEPFTQKLLLPTFDFRNQVTVMQAQDVFKLDSDNTFRVSAEYRHNTIGVTPFSGANVFYDVVSGGGMWDWKLLPTLSLTNAVRIDDLMLSRNGPVPKGFPFNDSEWNRSYTEPTFNSGLVWQADDDDTFRLTAARGAEMPSLNQLGGRLTQTGNSFSAGVPTLSPTVVTNFGLSWDRALPWLGAKGSIEAYHQTNDALSTLYGVTTIYGKYKVVSGADVGNSDATGVELSLKGEFLDDWRWGVSYTPEVIHDNITKPFSTANAAFQDTTPTHVVKANLGWAHGPWEIDGYAQYVSSFYGGAQPTTEKTVSGLGTPVLVYVSDYIAMDARVAYKVTDWATLSLSAQNLNQASLRETAGADVQRQVLGTFTVNF